MRKAPICLLLGVMFVPSLAIDRGLSGSVTVKQLERGLTEARGRSDGDLARTLTGVVLTERLNSTLLAQLKARLPGEKSQAALLALADSSAFLSPPASEIPATARPDAAAQRRMMAQAVNYLGKTLPLLPNLFATRDTTQFETRPAGADPADNSRLHLVSRSAVKVFYRDGREYLDTSAAKNVKSGSPDRGLMTWGEFGPILGTVLIDAARSKLEWGHWELGPAGLQAVFRYSVPLDKSHFEMRFCCVTHSYGLELDYVSQRVGYHGEIEVDPDSGTILRLSVIADGVTNNPIGESAMVVEYGPVDLGGKTYFWEALKIAELHEPGFGILARRHRVGDSRVVFVRRRPGAASGEHTTPLAGPTACGVDRCWSRRRPRTATRGSSSIHDSEPW